jgi:hypothetical protein
MTKDKPIVPDTKQLEEAFNGDLDLVLFFISWIKHGRNATEAYLELNPNVDRNSAQVLGSRQLAKIDREAVMKSYGLDSELYFQQLFDGLKAIKSDITGQTYPDHKTRQPYHDKLGKLLGIEQDKSGGPNIDLKVLVMPSELITKYDISSKSSDSSK